MAVYLLPYLSPETIVHIAVDVVEGVSASTTVGGTQIVTTVTVRPQTVDRDAIAGLPKVRTVGTRKQDYSVSAP